LPDHRNKIEKEDKLNRKIPWTLGLLAVFLLSACTPSSSAPPPTPTLAPQPDAPEQAPVEDPPAAVTIAVAPTATEESVKEPPPVAVVPTSRGNALHATDPGTVHIASGQPQLIEFFAFW